MDYNYHTNKVSDAVVLSLVYAFWAIIFLGACFTVYSWLFVKPIPEKIVSAPDNCVLSQVMPVEGGTITENESGEYRYEVFMTTKGVEVYKCK